MCNIDINGPQPTKWGYSASIPAYQSILNAVSKILTHSMVRIIPLPTPYFMWKFFSDFCEVDHCLKMTGVVS